jgi:putative addiction module component (TIGR02574 family)
MELPSPTRFAAPRSPLGSVPFTPFAQFDSGGRLVATCSRSQWFSQGVSMSSTVELLEAEALQLPAAERARLVEKLIASLDIDPEIEEAWAREVERRNAEIENGAVSLLSGPETLAKLRSEFR